MYMCVCVCVPVIERQCEFALGLFLIALTQQAQKLGLKQGLQQAVVLSLVQDEEVVLPRTTEKM